MPRDGISTSGVSSRGEGANGLVTIAYQPTGTVSGLGLSPSNPPPIVPDRPQSFTTTAFDASGASVADVTAQTTFSIAPDGTCAGSQCTATLAGPHTVTGTFDSGAGTLTATATLDVTAGPAGVVTASASDDQSARRRAGLRHRSRRHGHRLVHQSLGQHSGDVHGYLGLGHLPGRAFHDDSK